MRGEFNLGSLVITALLILGIWTGIKFAGAFVDNSRVETILTGLILQNKNTPEDPEVPAKVVAALKSEMDVNLLPTDVMIFKSVDGSRVRIDISYKAPIRIAGFGFDLQMESSASEAVKSIR